MRDGNKHYFKIPGGEIQVGRISRTVVMWFRGKKYWIKPVSRNWRSHRG